MCQLDFGCGRAVIKVALHLPVTKIELALRAAVEARPVSAPTVRKRPAEIRMPAAKYSRHKSGYLCHISPLVRIALVCITRSAPSIWAIKSTGLAKTAPRLCSWCSLVPLFVAPVLAYTYGHAREITIEQTPL